jgi:hypothetical protein
MNWMEKLEKKIGRYAIPNITRYMVIATLIGYALLFLSEVSASAANLILNACAFDVSRILHGQIWRLLTWIIIPSSAPSIWSLLFIVCLLMLGQNMENYLGTFKMNVYFIGGILLSDIGGILIYLIFRIPIYLTPYYILFSLYLMLGLFMPDATVRLYFVLPIRMKWLMIVYVLELGYEIYSYFSAGASMGGTATAFVIGIMYSAQIILALLNLGLFLFFCKHRVSHKQKKRQQEFHSQFAQPRPGSGITKHKCAICGRTEQDDPTLTFRYCSKCAGNYEYCQDHLFTHEHVRSM